MKRYLFAACCLLVSSPTMAKDITVEVIVPDYEISFSTLPDSIDVLGLRPGMDEETATRILTDAGYRFKRKDDGKYCTYTDTEFDSFNTCVDKDDGTRYFESGNPLEDVFLAFAPRQAGGKLLQVTRYIDYGKAKGSADIPKPEDLAKALKEKYPPPTGGQLDLTKIQCWAYKDGQPVTKYGWNATYCANSKDTPVDIRLMFSNSFRMETVLTDFSAKAQADAIFFGAVKSALDKAAAESVGTSAATPKL